MPIWNAPSAKRVLLAASIVLSSATVAAPASHAAQPSPCKTPKLTGLTLTAARTRAAHARCRLLIQGAKLEEAAVQTIERQSPSKGSQSLTVTVWLNPYCHREADYAPEITEPLVTPGPTELVSGFFLVGGPDDRRFSSPGCKLPAPAPDAGTVQVTNASGAIVARKTSTSGHFVELPLAAGTYTITGTFLDATINNAHPTKTEQVTIPRGHTVRDDFFLSIP